MTELLRYEPCADPEVSICIPMLDADVPNPLPVMQALIEHTKHLEFEIVMVNCEGELRGYTAPQNEAMAAARGEYLVALNDDVVVTVGWIDALIGQLCRTDREVWCATPDQTHCDGPQVFAPYCMVWHKDAWREIGGLDERFVLWCSDIDLARRLVDAGRPPARVKLPTPIHHELNGTTRLHPDELNPICVADLDRFRQKWGTDAEDEKHRLAALAS